MNTKNLFIKKIVFNQKYFLFLAFVIMCNSCKKDRGDVVPDSIFGKYMTSEGTGVWWANLIGLGTNASAYSLQIIIQHNPHFNQYAKAAISNKGNQLFLLQ